MFENLRTTSQALSTSHGETAKALKGSVLPIFEQLHAEIKNKTKDLNKGAGKASKAVDKARSDTQKHIDRLGQQTSSAGEVKAADDPYVLQRQVYHRLHKQIIEENGNRDDVIAWQNEFGRFEAHVIQTMQQGLRQLHQVMGNQADNTRTTYGNIVATSDQIPPSAEWDSFVQRNNNILIDPNGQKRSIQHVHFPHQDHPSTRPLIAGSLDRKGKLLKKYDTGYYVITPSKYLHEYKSDDDFSADPSPENSLYLPDCLIGAVDGTKFNIKGKDQSKGVLSKVSMSHEFAFQARTPEDARKWHQVALSVSGGASTSAPSSPTVAGGAASPTSPTDAQTTGTIGPAAGSAGHPTETGLGGHPAGTGVAHPADSGLAPSGNTGAVHPADGGLAHPGSSGTAHPVDGGPASSTGHTMNPITQTSQAEKNDYAPL